MGELLQPKYINAVALLNSTLGPLELLTHLQQIETRHGRIRSEIRWMARTLDLDILLYGDEMIQRDELQIPHPGITQRAFVLAPLYELNKHLNIPAKGQIKDFYKQEMLLELDIANS